MYFTMTSSIFVFFCILCFSPPWILRSNVVEVLGSVLIDTNHTTTTTHQDHATKRRRRPEAWTLDGKPLYAPQFDGLVGAGLDAQLAIARNNLQKPPKEDPAKHVWLGRRLAYKWMYQESIIVYTNAILHKWPNDAPLRRHRGHVYISTRNFTKAETDLQLAAHLIIDSDDEWEPDGTPNQYNLPLYSQHFNIYYHLGLSRYLQGDFTGAVEAYDDIFQVVLANNNSSPSSSSFSNDDSIASVVHWMYMSLRRSGYTDDNPKVQEILSKIHLGMKPLDVDTYYQLCLFYKGLRSEPDLSKISNPLDFATMAYGVGNYHYYNGKKTKAMSIWKHVVENHTYWPAFGYIAAEADLYREKHTVNFE